VAVPKARGNGVEENLLDLRWTEGEDFLHVF
jgi:hypothetical protein